MTTVIGVDPGLTGALALLSGDQLTIIDMPVCDNRVNPYALAELLAEWGPIDRVAVEHVAAMPRQGVASTFKFGVGYGMILAVLAVLERPVVHVTPAKWTGWHRVGADKDAHRRRAIELWPAHASMFARVKDDGRADAALIAAWCQTTLNQERTSA